MAIDEISIGHEQRYLTVVLDLETGAVVFVGDGKGAEALDRSGSESRAPGAGIEAVAIDMSQGLHQRGPLEPSCGYAGLRPFHVVKLMNDKLSDLRRELWSQPDKECATVFLEGWTSASRSTRGT